MSQVVSFLVQVVRVLARPVLLVRDGEADIDRTYLDQVASTGQHAAATGSAFVSMAGC